MSIAPAMRNTTPAYTIEENLAEGFVHMVVEGFFDMGTLSRHFADNADFVRRWRAMGRSIRVLIDAANLLPHSAEGQALVQQSTQRIYVPGDRVAVIVSSNLVKMQMRRALSQDQIINFFVSDSAAMTWLMAYA
jgi:hypothetical protein